MASLELKHIYKVYQGGVRAVNDFNLKIKDQSFVVLVGPSGCGKSTTLRMIAGLENITSGQLYIDDSLVNDVESKNRDIAMVFQSYALYPHMTVYQNMGFGLKLRHEKPAVIKEKVEAAAEILEISDLLDRKPRELSGGQRQRVALGRAIVRTPKVFLLDEPLSNLDAKLRVQMRTEITKLHEKLHATFIYVTHDQTEAMTMGDTIVVMNKGFVQQADAPVTLFEDPTNLFVATFLGSPQMNIIESQIVSEGKKMGVVLEGIGSNIVYLKEETAKQIVNSRLDLSKNYLFGIRPDHITLSDKGIPATVEAVEQLGDETLIHTHIENHQKAVVVKAPLTANVKSGDEVFLNFDNDRIYLFDIESHESLIGLPSYNHLPCHIEGNAIVVGNQAIEVDDDYLSHLLARAYGENNYLAIKPEYVELEETTENRPLSVKVEFLEKRTNYDIVFSSVKGVEEYLIFRKPKNITAKPGDMMTIYLPLDHVLVADENGDSLYSREIVYPNLATAKLATDKNGKRVVSINGGETLVYDELPYEDGEYSFELKQDKVEVVFNKKMCKAMGREFFKPQKGTYLTVSCYDEEPQQHLNTIFAQIKGFPEYVTLLIENNFSVYKMPQFKVFVPSDGFELKPLE